MEQARYAEGLNAAAPGDALVELLRRCTVRIVGEMPGAGFFVAPGLVLTCAHVVGLGRRRGVLRGVEAWWGGDRSRQVRLRQILRDEDEDLALLEVGFDDHPCVALDTDVRYDDPLYAAGFPSYGSGQQLDGVAGKFEARTSSPHPRETRYLLKVRDAQIVPGFSGGPLLNQRTGSIVGVVTETRGAHTDLGGWAVPVELALRELAGLAEASAAWHARDSVWSRTVTRWLEDGPFAGRRVRADDTLPLANNIRNFTVAYLGSPSAPEPFGGRAAALEELTAWLTAADGPPYLLLTAVAGRGKSALLVRWVQMLEQGPPGNNRDCRVIFVPISLRYETSTAADVFSALASRLHRAHGESAPLPPDVNWQQAAATALARDAPEGSTLLVVIDGLDETTGWGAGPATFPIRPGVGVRMVVSARHTAQRGDTAAWRTALGWTSPEVAASMELRPLDGPGLRDVLTRMGSPLDTLGERSDVVDELARLTDGDPLLVGMSRGRFYCAGNIRVSLTRPATISTLFL